MAQARVLFSSKGYGNTSIKDIAKACGCEPSNIYNYFVSKESLLYEILREEMDRLLSSMKDLEEDDAASPVEALRLLIYNHVELTLSYRRLSKLLFDEEMRSLLPAHRKEIIAYRDHYDRILRKIIRRGIKTGDFDEVDEKLMGYSIASMVVRTRVWFRPRGRLSIKEIADIIFIFALNGLRKDRRLQNQKTAPNVI
jgi:AcrR family transcriptional regulator